MDFEILSRDVMHQKILD